MTQTFHLVVLEREVRRIKQKHLNIMRDILRQYFRNQAPPPVPAEWCEFDVRRHTHQDYLFELFTLGCYLLRPAITHRLEKVFFRLDEPSICRRTATLFKQLATIDMDTYATYCAVHHNDVNQSFFKIREQMQRYDRVDSSGRDLTPTVPGGICYALSLSGTDYFLGHILVSEDRSIPEQDIKVAVMTKESVSHTPKVSAVVLCTLRYVPSCHRFYRQFTLLDTRGQGLYDFTILINRVTRTLEDVKSILVADRTIRYVITSAP